MAPDPRRAKLLHRVFALGIWVKGIDGVLEIIGGVVLLLTSNAALNRLVITFTNPVNGVSLTENISGPAQIDLVSGTAFGDGPGAGPLPGLGSGIWLGFGRVDFVTGQTLGHFIPLCPLLAGS